MPTAQWKGLIIYSLISAPVKLFTAARTDSVSFNQLHVTCGCRINQQIVCNTCGGTPVPRTDIIKGYEYEKGSYLRFTEAEIKALAPKSSNAMTVEKFVNLDDIDPMLYDAGYFMVPDGDAGKKVYALLMADLGDNRKAAVARVTMHQREHLVVIRRGTGAFRHGLVLHTLFYKDEAEVISEFSSDMLAGVTLADAERKMANTLLEPQQFDLGEYHDSFKAAIQALIEARKADPNAPVGDTAAAPKPAAPDLMAMLKASLAAKKPVVVEATATVVAEEPVAAEKPVKKAKKAAKVA